MPANDLKELTAWLKANPDKASLGHIGPGSPAHVAGILFQKQTGTRFQFVTDWSAVVSSFASPEALHLRLSQPGAVEPAA
jgi:hypothetical protein